MDSRLLILFLAAFVAGCSSYRRLPELPAGSIPPTVARLDTVKEVDWAAAFARLDPRSGTGPASAVRGIDAFVQLAGATAAFSSPFSMDDATRRLVEMVAEGLTDGDLTDVYRKVAAGRKGGVAPGRGIGFLARRAGGVYRFTLDPDPEEKIGSFGDFYTRIGLEPIARGAVGERAFALEGAVGVNFGAISPRQVLQWIVSLLGKVEQGVGPRPGPGPSGSRMGRADIHLLASLEASFPDTFRWFSRFFAFEDVVVCHPGIRGASPAVGVKLVLRPRFAALRRDFPRLYRLLASKKYELGVSARLVDSMGRRVLSYGFDTRNMLLHLDAVVWNGQLLAVDEAGKPVPFSGLYLLQSGVHRFVVEYDLFARMLGLTMTIKGLKGKVVYEVGHQALNLTTTFDEIPSTVKVEGRLLGVVPGWLLMTDFQTLLEKFVICLTRGRKGAGTVVSLYMGASALPRSAGKVLLRVGAAAEVPDSGLLRVILRFWRRKFVPGLGPAKRRAGSFRRQFLRNLVADLTRQRARFAALGRP